MRELQTADVFKAARIVREADVKNEVQRVAKMIEDGQKINAKELGIEVILNCISNCSDPKVEAIFYDLVAGWLEIKPEEVKTMEFFTMFDKLVAWKDMYMTEGKTKAFFSCLSKLMK